MKALQRYQMSKTEKAALKAEIARQASTETCEKPLRKNAKGRQNKWRKQINAIYAKIFM